MHVDNKEKYCGNLWKNGIFHRFPQTVSSKSTVKNRKKYGANPLNVRCWNVTHLYTCAKTITTKTIYI